MHAPRFKVRVEGNDLADGIPSSKGGERAIHKAHSAPPQMLEAIPGSLVQGLVYPHNGDGLGEGLAEESKMPQTLDATG